MEERREGVEQSGEWWCRTWRWMKRTSGLRHPHRDIAGEVWKSSSVFFGQLKFVTRSHSGRLNLI